MRFAREALPFVAPLVALAIALIAFDRPRLGTAAALVALAALLFFRIPSRPGHGSPAIILAPANGVVTRVDERIEPTLGEEPVQRVVTFLSVFNVHVQRAPVSGTVVVSDYKPGRKVAAFRENAGEVNEHHWTVIETAEGERYGMRQIAGLLARRVVSYTSVGDAIERGELMGIIKFGSRVDLYLPRDYPVTVEKGDRMIEGVTIVASRDPERAAAP